jgi:hypothetical protein
MNTTLLRSYGPRAQPHQPPKQILSWSSKVSFTPLYQEFYLRVNSPNETIVCLKCEETKSQVVT